MTDKNAYVPGDFCWSELSTSNAERAKQFYAPLFGWTIKEIPMGPDDPPYVIVLKDGKEAAALFQNPKVPPHWAAYVSVASADDAARKAKSLGATVLAEPFDVMDAGRMAVLQDPQGATFAVWQAKQHIGARVINEPGCMCWNELYTTDIDAARKFYSSLFDWKLKISPGYTEAHTVSGEATAGMMQITEHMQGMPPHWMPYFAVTDCDAVTKQAQSLGGQVHVGPMDIENVGRFSVLGDPLGASFAIIKLTRP